MCCTYGGKNVSRSIWSSRCCGEAFILSTTWPSYSIQTVLYQAVSDIVSTVGESPKLQDVQKGLNRVTSSFFFVFAKKQVNTFTVTILREMAAKFCFMEMPNSLECFRVYKFFKSSLYFAVLPRS